MGFPWFKKREKPVVEVDGLPPVVLKLNGTMTEGPNCWNATIMFFDSQEPVRFVSPQIMIEWLNCNTVPDEGKFCAVGSILVLYGDDPHEHTVDGLLHTAVYVGPGVLWHKRGVGGQYEFVTERQLRAIYFEANRFEYRLAV